MVGAAAGVSAMGGSGDRLNRRIWDVDLSMFVNGVEFFFGIYSPYFLGI